MTDTRKGDWMQTASGVEFYPLDPRPEEIHITDIAHALSMSCRYGGHCKRFYSVAEHCVLMAERAPEHLRLCALMHDASEAYLSDVIRPIKPSLTGYHAIEERMMQVIAGKFGFSWPMPAEVKRLDEAILADERDQNMTRPPRDWQLREPALGVKLRYWSPIDAAWQFENAFYHYGGK
jgi:hypothetical protein